MVNKLYYSIAQRIAKPTLPREPEAHSVMVGEEQVREYTRDGEVGSLAILYELIINSISRIAPRHGKALDICCGSGHLLCLLAEALPDIQFTGIDLSDQMLRFAKEKAESMRLSNVNVVAGDMTNIAPLFESPKFDLITWNLALHHCDDEDTVIEVLNQIPKLLKPNGTFFLFDINRPKTKKIAYFLADTFNRRQGEWYYRDSLDSYKAAFTYDELADILRSSELRDYVHVEPHLMNYFQIVAISPRGASQRPRMSHLHAAWQKYEYLTLRAAFAGRLP